MLGFHDFAAQFTCQQEGTTQGVFRLNIQLDIFGGNIAFIFVIFQHLLQFGSNADFVNLKYIKQLLHLGVLVILQQGHHDMLYSHGLGAVADSQFLRLLNGIFQLIRILYVHSTNFLQRYKIFQCAN